MLARLTEVDVRHAWCAALKVIRQTEVQTQFLLQTLAAQKQATDELEQTTKKLRKTVTPLKLSAALQAHLLQAVALQQAADDLTALDASDPFDPSELPTLSAAKARASPAD